MARAHNTKRDRKCLQRRVAVPERYEMARKTLWHSRYVYFVVKYDDL